MLINRSDFPDKKLEKLISFCCPKNFQSKLCDIIVKNCRSGPYNCHYYYGGYNIPKIILRFTQDKKWFPLYFKLRKDKIARTGYVGEYNLIDLDSCLVFFTAHEIRHDLQHADDKMKFWLYHDMKSAETDADKYALRKLRKYQKLKSFGINIFK